MRWQSLDRRCSVPERKPKPAKKTSTVTGRGRQAAPAVPTNGKSASKVEKVGVYVCHCGGNISDVVDVDRVTTEAAQLDGVAVARHVMFMCSDEGQKTIVDDIEALGLDRVVVAACTPKLHETTFRRAVMRGGMNPYLFLPANIREQASWAHPHSPKAATEKAIALVRAAVAKAELLEPLDMVRVAAVHRALVIGGGVAGLRAALDLACQGFGVTLVEKSPFLGGRSVQLHTVFPTEDLARPLIHRLIREAMAQPNLTVLTNTEVTQLTGYVGDFKATLRTTPRGVTGELADPAAAIAACPVEAPNEFDDGLSRRRAIYQPYPGSEPDMPAIDWGACTRCGACVEAAGGRGIELTGEATQTQIEAGAVVVATGFDHYEPRDGEYGYGRSPRIVTLPQVHRMLDPEGPTGGRLEIDGRVPRAIAFIHCVGSRQIEGVDEPGPDGKLHEYCSRVCCTATLQAANEIRKRYPKSAVYDLYRDIRTYGWDQEPYYVDASKAGVVFLRFANDARPTVEVADGTGFPLKVTVTDTLTFGAHMQVPVDLVVLSVGVMPRDIAGLVDMTKAPVGSDGFLLEVHPKLRPVESAIPGLLLAGTAQAPMDITEATSAASAAAAKVTTLLARDHVEMEPFVARVDPSLCDGCGLCLDACHYAGAIALQDVEVEEGVFEKRAYVNPVACKGCGACVPSCPVAALDVAGWEIEQYRAMIDAITAQPLTAGARS
jgi:heterodisulfide reductase subunit A